MQTFEIKNRWDGKVLFSADGETLRDAVQKAVREHADLRGADLRGADLVGANLRDADLGGANLRSADLVGAHLGGANLRGADLVGAHLVGAHLVGADLGGANLVGANLRGANLVGADLDGADGKKLTLVGKRPILIFGPLGSRCDYMTAYLTDSGVYVRAGCFFDTLEAFRAAVIAEHADNEHGREYMAVIAMIEVHASIWSPVTAAVTEVA